MREVLAAISLAASPAELPVLVDQSAPDSPSWFVGCHGPLYNLSLIVPSALFVAYLASLARTSVAKLTSGRSYVMIAYYVVLWLVSAVNLLWCLVQVWQCTAAKQFSWNILSLFTKSGMLFLEVSLVAFLLQGNNAGGMEVLKRTFVISGVIVSADTLLKVIYIFGFGVPLFADSNETTNRARWGLLIVHKLLLTSVYGFLIFLHHSKWRERLPGHLHARPMQPSDQAHLLRRWLVHQTGAPIPAYGLFCMVLVKDFYPSYASSWNFFFTCVFIQLAARPSFYKYVCAMLLLNTMSLFGCLLAGNRSGFGIWLFNVTIVCYHSLYLPLLYVVFLADFFQEEDLRMENVYYSEMKDAGFFDDDWD